jgi:hypothetical protein
MRVVCDTNVFIRLFLQDEETIRVLTAIGSGNIVMPVIVAMELFAGMRNKQELQQMVKHIRSHNLLQLDAESSRLAMELLRDFRLSHGLQIPDALIGGMAIANGLPLYTYNQKDFRFLPDIQLYPLS